MKNITRNMQKIAIALMFIASFHSYNGRAQGMAISTTGASADSSALLDVSSTSQGILTPRMTTAQKSAIHNPATGLLVYQTDSAGGFYYYNGSSWLLLNSAAFNDTLTRNLNTNGYMLTNNGSAGITINSTGSIAMGSSTTAGGSFSTAMGINTTASGSFSTAMGGSTKASGSFSTAMGAGTRASGDKSTAMGNNAMATAEEATAIGYNTTASGNQSTAMGQNTTASGAQSTAMGTFVSTNGESGSFAIGDASTGIVATNDVINEMMMRFAGGYKLYTNSNATQGLALNTSGVAEYLNNVAGSYDSRSLVDKNYVDSSMIKNKFNDTLTGNLYTNGYMLTGDGATGILIGADGSVAIGDNAAAAGETSTAMGSNTTASGIFSTAMGGNTIANGLLSTAMGGYTTAGGDYSTAMGWLTTAGGDVSVAMGQSTTASGNQSTAMGQNTTASGTQSTAMGTFVSTNGKSGSFAIGDASTGIVATNDAINEMMMRFAGGYKLYTNSNATQGLALNTSGVAEYLNNVAGSYDSRSLVDKNYVDSSMIKNKFNDTLTSNLNTNGHMLTQDGAYGETMYDSGIVVFTGSATTISSSLELPVTGPGKRMIWDGHSGTFAVGTATVDQFDALPVNGIAMGYNPNLTGTDGGVCIGHSTSAFNRAVAIGNNVEANGGESVALGNFVSTNGYIGSFIFGDNSTTAGANNDHVNQMMMRFAGGYKLYTNSNATQGLALNTSGVAEYMNNVAGSYDSRSLVDKNYVDSNVIKSKFNDTLQIDLYTNGHMFTDDGTTGITLSANGDISMGASCNASHGSIAIGNSCIANEGAAISMGTNSIASADYAMAIGYNVHTSGAYATGLGLNATAAGQYSYTMGNNITANGDYSTALGNYVSTNHESGSFIVGDNSTTTTTFNSAANQMVMRFANGYELFTNSSSTVGAQIAAGGNSWSTISDRRKKENFAPVNGENFLHKVDTFNLTSWNYKGQNAATFRHYGPMAQDFYGAFGKDSYGVIGNDTTINQADMEGVSFIMIQALEKRTKEQAAEIEVLKKENASLKEKQVQYADLSKRLEAVEAMLWENKTAAVK